MNDDDQAGSEKRSRRLTKEKVDIQVRQGNRIWRGKTTGLNENGFGARLLTMEGQARENTECPDPGLEIETSFLVSSLKILPVAAQLLRFEGSWARPSRPILPPMTAGLSSRSNSPW